MHSLSLKIVLVWVRPLKWSLGFQLSPEANSKFKLFMTFHCFSFQIVVTYLILRWFRVDSQGSFRRDSEDLQRIFRGSSEDLQRIFSGSSVEIRSVELQRIFIGDSVELQEVLREFSAICLSYLQSKSESTCSCQKERKLNWGWRSGFQPPSCQFCAALLF